MNNIFDKFIEIRPIVIEGEPNAHSVYFKVGVQKFCISPLNCENKEHAEWFAGMFKTALTNMLQEIGNLSPDKAQGDVSTVTNCPTCGSAVKVGGDGETHYYIPITPTTNTRE